MKNELIIHFTDGTCSAGLYVYLLRDSREYGAVRSISGFAEYGKASSFVALTKEYGDMGSVVRVYPIDKVMYFEEVDPLMINRELKLKSLINPDSNII